MSQIARSLQGLVRRAFTVQGGIWVAAEHRPNIPFAPHGWRRRRVGELWASGDLRVICDLGEARPIETREIGTRTLGIKDGFDDYIITPRKKPQPNKQVSNPSQDEQI